MALFPMEKGISLGQLGVGWWQFFTGKRFCLPFFSNLKRSQDLSSFGSAQLSLLRDSRGKALAVLHDKERESEAMDGHVESSKICWLRILNWENLILCKVLKFFFPGESYMRMCFLSFQNWFLIDRVYLRSEIVILTFQIHRFHEIAGLLISKSLPAFTKLPRGRCFQRPHKCWLQRA